MAEINGNQEYLDVLEVIKDHEIKRILKDSKINQNRDYRFYKIDGILAIGITTERVRRDDVSIHDIVRQLSLSDLKNSIQIIPNSEDKEAIVIHVSKSYIEDKWVELQSKKPETLIDELPEGKEIPSVDDSLVISEDKNLPEKNDNHTLIDPIVFINKLREYINEYLKKGPPIPKGLIPFEISLCGKETGRLSALIKTKNLAYWQRVNSALKKKNGSPYELHSCFLMENKMQVFIGDTLGCLEINENWPDSVGEIDEIVEEIPSEIKSEIVIEKKDPERRPTFMNPDTDYLESIGEEHPQSRGRQPDYFVKIKTMKKTGDLNKKNLAEQLVEEINNEIGPDSMAKLIISKFSSATIQFKISFNKDFKKKIGEFLKKRNFIYRFAKEDRVAVSFSKSREEDNQTRKDLRQFVRERDAIIKISRENGFSIRSGICPDGKIGISRVQSLISKNLLIVKMTDGDLEDVSLLVKLYQEHFSKLERGSLVNITNDKKSKRPTIVIKFKEDYFERPVQAQNEITKEIPEKNIPIETKRSENKDSRESCFPLLLEYFYTGVLKKMNENNIKFVKAGIGENGLPQWSEVSLGEINTIIFPEINS